MFHGVVLMMGVYVAVIPECTYLLFMLWIVLGVCVVLHVSLL